MWERKKSLERLLVVNTRWRQLEEARLGEIETQRMKALEERRAMLEFLDRAEGKDPLLLRLACDRVAASERGVAALDVKAESQRQILMRRTAQKRGVENLLKEAAATLDREEEKRALLEIAERLAGGPATSLP